MKTAGSPSRSAQRIAVLKLFETVTRITKYDVSEKLGIGERVAGNLLSAMRKDGRLDYGDDLPGTPQHPLRTFVLARKVEQKYNPRLIMQLRRRTNEQLGIEDR